MTVSGTEHVLPLLEKIHDFARELLRRSECVAILQTLTDLAPGVVGAVGASVVLLPSETAPAAVVSTPIELRDLEHLQLHAGRGLACETSAKTSPVSVSDLRTMVGAWSPYAEIANNLGLRAAAGIPMRVGKREAVLQLYAAQPRTWSQEDLALAQTMADLAASQIDTVGLINEQRELAAQLQNALESRVVIEQAKGVLAASQGIDVHEAFERIRADARRNQATVATVAEAVVRRGLRPGRTSGTVLP